MKVELSRGCCQLTPCRSLRRGRTVPGVAGGAARCCWRPAGCGFGDSAWENAAPSSGGSGFQHCAGKEGNCLAPRSNPREAACCGVLKNQEKFIGVLCLPQVEPPRAEGCQQHRFATPGYAVFICWLFPAGFLAVFLCLWHNSDALAVPMPPALRGWEPQGPGVRQASVTVCQEKLSLGL